MKMALFLCVLIVAIGLFFYGVVLRPYRFTIPVGTTVAFLGRLVEIREHHVGAGVGARRDPARYVYVYVDDPPPYVWTVAPFWDDAERRWTHSQSGVLAYPKGHEEATQVAQFNQLADYRR